METLEIPQSEPESGISPAEASPKKSLRSEFSSLRRLLKQSRDLTRLSLLALAFLGLIGFLYFAKVIFLPLAFALMLSFLLRPLVRGLAYLRIPATLGAAIVITVAFVALGNGVSRLQKPATQWLDKAPENLKQVESKIRHLIQRAQLLSLAAAQVGEITKMPQEEKPTRVEINSSYLTDTALSYTTTFLTGMIETIVLLYFFLATGDRLMKRFINIAPAIEDRQEVAGIIHEVQHNISAFLFTITVINICLGGLVALGMSLVGMPNPIMWGVVASVLNFIPYFGPVTGVIILAITGLLTFDSVGQALLPPLIYLALHAVESNFVTPMVLGRRLTLNPIVIFLSLMFWMWLWGIPGALIAVPLLMTLKVLCDHFKILAPIGELLSS